MDMKRILIRIDSPIYEQGLPGGAEKLIQDLIRALSSSDFVVHVLCPTGDESVPRSRNPRYHTFDHGVRTSAIGQFLNSVQGFWKCRRLLSEYEFDLALDNVSHIPYYPLHALASNNAVFLHSCQLRDAHLFSSNVQAYGIELIERTLPYLKSPYFVCSGQSTAKRVHKELGYDRTKVLNPAINLNRYRFAFSPDSNFVLSLGRLGPRKNLQCLLHAWDLADTRDLRLRICGSGPEEERLRTLARTLGLDDVIFEGRVSEERKLELFTTARIFAFPTYHEGYGITGLEAMASGTPVVGADTHGLRDYINHGETGLLYDRSSPADMAEKLEYAIKNDEHMERIANRGQAVAANHSLQQFESKAVAVFENLVRKTAMRR
jgi:glycosyltransferase involved in cell wall biosynthesis